MFAQIAVNKKNTELDHLFTYIIPEEFADILVEGALVRVPFGREKLLGIVVKRTLNADYDKLKPILEVISPQLLTEELLEMGKYIAKRYLAPLATVLFSMAVFGTNIKKPERLKNLPVKDSEKEQWHQLTPAQQAVLDKINQQPAGRFLLHGVTGSGKTEIYLHLFQQAFANNRQALLLVPEIALTPQLTAIFVKRFGARVQVLHSKLSAGERMLVWQKVMQGEIEGVIGARSAIFAPFKRLGVIIMDEEHEYSFKQENVPRFHTRVLAAWRAKHHLATLVYGSATPSLESYYAALTGKLTLLSMPERIAERPLPQVQIVDLRLEGKAGNRSIFSRVLQEKIAERLEKKEQVILFLNRRGYSAFVGCRDCGEIMYCPRCAVTLTYHQGIGQLRCHYCEYTAKLPAKCPSCGSSDFRKFGVGTERIEEVVKGLYPQARIVRMDVDTTARKGTHTQIYTALKNGDADILIGTQMVAKGLDLPMVTLVGVIDADISLFMPDFRAREKTFQLLTQVAGRAGRGTTPGEVIFQTFYPEDYTLLAAAKQNYKAFCEQELYKRRIMDYPPFSTMLRLVITGEDLSAVEHAAVALGGMLKQVLPKVTHILGPAPAPIAKLRKKHRWHIHIKDNAINNIIGKIKSAVDCTAAEFKKYNVLIHIDVDPYSAL